MQHQTNMNGMTAEEGMAQANAQYQYNQAHQASASGLIPQPVPSAQLPPAAVHTSQMLAAGLFGLVVVGTGTLGANLHKVGDGDMTMGEAVSQSLSKGAVGGLATAAATAASTALTRGGLLGLAVTIATATGVSYLLSKP